MSLKQHDYVELNQPEMTPLSRRRTGYVIDTHTHGKVTVKWDNGGGIQTLPETSLSKTPEVVFRNRRPKHMQSFVLVFEPDEFYDDFDLGTR